MKCFRYSVRDLRGRRMKGEVLAPNQEEAVRLLQESGVYVTAVSSPRDSSGPISFRCVSAPDDQKLFLLESWSMFLEAGFSVQSSILRLRKTIRHKGISRALQRIQGSVDRGMRLSEAVAASRLFPSSWVAILEVGEQAGDFVGPFRDMRHQVLQLHRLKEEALRILLMPSFLVGLTLVWFWIFLHSVVPTLLEFGSQVGISNPMVTLLAGMTQGLSYATRLLVVLLGLAVLFALRLNRSNQVMGFFQTWIPAKTPVLGPMVSALHLLVVASELRIQLEAGISLVTALHTLSLSTPHPGIRRELFEVYAKVREGVPADEAICGLSFVPPEQKMLLIAGNASGQLPKVLSLLVRSAQEDLRFRTRNLVTFLQAAAVFGCGVLVGSVMIAYFSLWISHCSSAFSAVHSPLPF